MQWFKEFLINEKDEIDLTIIFQPHQLPSKPGREAKVSCGSNDNQCTTTTSALGTRDASLDRTQAAKKLKQKKITHKTTQKVNIDIILPSPTILDINSSSIYCEGGNGLNVPVYLLILEMKTLDLEGYGSDFPFYCPP